MTDRPAGAEAARPAGRRRRWRNSIATRIVALLVLVVTVVALGIGVGSVLVLRGMLLDRLDDQARLLAQAPAGRSGAPRNTGAAAGPAPATPSPSDVPPGGSTPAPTPAPTTTTILSADDPSGRPAVVGGVRAIFAPGLRAGVYTTANRTDRALTPAQLTALEAVATSPPTSATQATSVDLGGSIGVVRVFAVPDANGDATRVGGMSTAQADETTRDLASIFALTSLAAIAGAGLLGWRLVGNALRPLDRVAATASAVSARSLDARDIEMPERVSAEDAGEANEVGDVGRALNELLDRVESALRGRDASEQRLRSFVADASHELRTPLASVAGYAELAAKDPHPLSETQSTSLTRIRAESTRMTSLVEELLLLARLDAGQPLRRQRFDLAPLLIEGAADAAARDGEREYELDLPDHALEAVGDADRIRQVIANLTGNARAHTPPGTRVELRLREGRLGAGEPAAILEVADDGPGIPDALRVRLFERFARGDRSRSRASGGAGLGLAISRAIVEAHGGEISAPFSRTGALIRVALPLAGADAARRPGL